MNDDCELRDKNWLKEMLEKTKTYSSAGIFGCKITYPDGSIQRGVKKGKTYFYEQAGKEDKGFSEDSGVKEVMGAFMFIKKEVFEKIGTFDEGFSPFYGEESDLCFRAKKAGFETQYLGSINLVHHRNKSISKLSREEVWFIKKRNSIRLEFKHYSFFKIILLSIIHLGSILKKDRIGMIKKLKLLIKAYAYNLSSK